MQHMAVCYKEQLWNIHLIYSPLTSSHCWKYVKFLFSVLICTWGTVSVIAIDYWEMGPCWTRTTTIFTLSNTFVTQTTKKILQDKKQKYSLLNCHKNKEKCVRIFSPEPLWWMKVQVHHKKKLWCMALDKICIWICQKRSQFWPGKKMHVFLSTCNILSAFEILDGTNSGPRSSAVEQAHHMWKLFVLGAAVGQKIPLWVTIDKLMDSKNFIMKQKKYMYTCLLTCYGQ